MPFSSCPFRSHMRVAAIPSMARREFEDFQKTSSLINMAE